MEQGNGPAAADAEQILNDGAVNNRGWYED